MLNKNFIKLGESKTNLLQKLKEKLVDIDSLNFDLFYHF
jgi:hypothetical protein